jgi:hypothetical protein
MKRFRSNFGDGLALVALAMVFALWLGHFDGTTARAASAIQPAPRPLAASSAAATRDTKGCTVCAFVTLADRLFSTTPPLMMLPEAVELLYRTTDAEFVHLKSAGVVAQPRALHHAS